MFAWAIACQPPMVLCGCSTALADPGPRSYDDACHGPCRKLGGSHWPTCVLERFVGDLRERGLATNPPTPRPAHLSGHPTQILAERRRSIPDIAPSASDSFRQLEVLIDGEQGTAAAYAAPLVQRLHLHDSNIPAKLAEDDPQPRCAQLSIKRLEPDRIRLRVVRLGERVLIDTCR